MERLATPEDVRNCYRLLLGRDPEDTDVLMNVTEQGMSQKDLVVTFLKSEEARLRFGNLIQIADNA